MRQKEYHKSLGTRIDLSKTFNPHPLLVKTWADSKVQDHYFKFEDIAENRNEKRIFILANASKPAQPIKHKIISCYRKKGVGNKEYCFFHDHMMTKDYFGNYIDHTRVIGRWEKPNIEVQRGMNTGGYNPDTGQVTEEVGPVSSSISSVTTEYDYEFKDIIPQLKEWYNDGTITDETNFTVIQGNRKYSTSFESFLELSIEDIILINQSGINAAIFTNTNQLLAMAKKVATDKVTELMEGKTKKDKIPASLRVL